MTVVARAVYVLFGVLAIGLGLLALFRPALALPPEAVSPLTAHLVREEGCAALFVGLMAFWCVRHFERRRPVHFALLLFSASFAAIHWYEYFQARRGLASPIANSIPLLALLVITQPPQRQGEA